MERGGRDDVPRLEIVEVATWIRKTLNEGRLRGRGPGARQRELQLSLNNEGNQDPFVPG